MIHINSTFQHVFRPRASQNGKGKEGRSKRERNRFNGGWRLREARGGRSEKVETLWQGMREGGDKVRKGEGMDGQTNGRQRQRQRQRE